MSVPIKVVLLGSGSSFPSPDRYHPSLAITYEGRSVLFDCGEAAQIRLQEAGISPMKIDAIFITHLHGDHFFGLPGIIYSMALQGREKPLTVYGPEGVGSLKCLLDVGYHQLTFPVEFKEIKRSIVHEEIHWSVEAIGVNHGIPAVAYRFKERDIFRVLKSKIKGVKTGPWIKRILLGERVKIKGKEFGPEILEKMDGRKIVYSGDCKPSESLIEFSRNADLLFHESTYGSDVGDMASERMHSTSVDAAEIARKASVKKLVLFHFSRRYKTTKQILEDAKKIFPNTISGKDLMKIKI